MANKYDTYFDFRLAEKADIPAIMRYLKEYWQEDHILANDEEFFRYYFCSGIDAEHVNVFLMFEKNGNIAGMIGQVIYGTDSEGYIFFSNSMTNVRSDIKVPMAGVELQRRLPQYCGKYTEFSCGTNPITMRPIYEKILGYDCGVMNLHYLLNPEIEEFKLIRAKNEKTTLPKSSAVRLQKAENIKDISFDFSKKYAKLPYKDKEYLTKRYDEHPIWEYLKYAVLKEGTCAGVVILRKAEYMDASLLFWVDYIGDISVISEIGQELVWILKEQGAECIHMLEAGCPKEVLEKCGFKEVDLDGKAVIIPTYFEPFALINVKNVYVRSTEDVIIFKGTGDQDNPKIRRMT